MAVRKGGWFQAMLVAVGIFLPSLAHSEFYVGGYLGPGFTSSIDPHFEFYINAEPEKYIFATRTGRGVSVEPSLLLGGKIGYWFTKKSVFGLQMPSWLKYFGFELDVSYQRLHWPRQDVTFEPSNFTQSMEANSTVLTAAFLFMARYGFYPDADIPLGRLQPYFGIGPAIFVTNTFVDIGKDFRATEGDLGLAVETGLRYMLNQKISLNAAFRYRYLRNHVSADDHILDVVPCFIIMRSTYQMYDLVFGVEYHF